MQIAEVIGMRLSKGCQWTDYCGAIRIDIGQGCHRGALAQ